MENNMIPEGWHRHSYGGGLVENTAFVAKSAYVGRNALILDNARVLGNAQICDYTKVYSSARVLGNAVVLDTARVYGNAQISGNAYIYDSARICDNAKIYGNAHIYSNARICGNAKITGSAWADRGTHTRSPLVIQGSRDILHYLGKDSDGHWISIGCEKHTIIQWLRQYRKIGKNNEYSKEETEEYHDYLELFSRRIAGE